MKNLKESIHQFINTALTQQKVRKVGSNAYNFNGAVNLPWKIYMGISIWQNTLANQIIRAISDEESV